MVFKSAVNLVKPSKEARKFKKKKGIVLVVFAMDTEGPVTDKRNPELLGSWEKVDWAIAKLFDRRFRNKYKDSFKAGLKISWFILHWTGFKTNPVYRDFGYHRIYDHYINKWGNKIKKYGDEIYWHYHHPPLSGIGNEWNTDWTSNNEYFNILNRMIIDRKYFPSVFRAGGTIENNDSSSWLEQWIPFDYSSRASDKINWFKKEADGRLLKEVCNWTKAPKNWGFYHPNYENYQKRGKMKQRIFRCLDLNSSVHIIKDSEVQEAFSKANLGKDVVLAFFEHDFRDIAERVECLLLEKIKKISQSYPGVKFKYQNALNAARLVTSLREEKKPDFKIQLLGSKLIIKANKKLFGPQPYFVIKFINSSRYQHYPLDITGKNIWQHILEYPKKKSIFGIAANDSWGNTKVSLYKYENSRINPC